MDAAGVLHLLRAAAGKILACCRSLLSIIITLYAVLCIWSFGYAVLSLILSILGLINLIIWGLFVVIYYIAYIAFNIIVIKGYIVVYIFAIIYKCTYMIGYLLSNFFVYYSIIDSYSDIIIVFLYEFFRIAYMCQVLVYIVGLLY